MDIRHLRYFLAVAEELHFGRAAMRLHIAQPPLSQAIRQLEEELGAALFTRTSRSVRLTAAGAALVGDARTVLEQLAQAEAKVRRVHAGEAGELVVGYMNPVMDAVLCRALAAFRVKKPDVALRLRELPSPVQLDELRSGRLDIAFVRAGSEDQATAAGAELAFCVVAREPYVLALPTEHPLAKLKRVPLRRAGHYPFLLFQRETLPALHDAIMAAFRANGGEPVISQVVQGKHASLTLVAAGMGLCLVPASAAQWRRSGVVLRPVDLEQSSGDADAQLPVVEMHAVWVPGRVPASGLALAEIATRVNLQTTAHRH